MPLPRGGAHSSAHSWSPEEAAEFAARRDFRFVQLLSMDRAAFRTARRLGMFAVRSTVTRSECETHILYIHAHKAQGHLPRQAAAKARGTNDDNDGGPFARGATAELCSAPQRPPP